MKFELLDYTFNDESLKVDENNLIINSIKDFNNLGIKLSDEVIDDNYFNNHLLLKVIFFDGSLPKRTIKSLNYDSIEKTITVKTNKEDLTFSTMDYRMRYFVIKINKVDVKTIKLINNLLSSFTLVPFIKVLRFDS